jgi:hypothetical protein
MGCNKLVTNWFVAKLCYSGFVQKYFNLTNFNIFSNNIIVLFCLGVSLYTTIKLSKPILLVSGFTIYIKYYQHFHICINILNF